MNGVRRGLNGVRCWVQTILKLLQTSQTHLKLLQTHLKPMYPTLLVFIEGDGGVGEEGGEGFVAFAAQVGKEGPAVALHLLLAHTGEGAAGDEKGGRRGLNGV